MDKKIMDSLNDLTDSLDKSIIMLQKQTKEFGNILELAYTNGKTEIGHIYTDLANLLRVITGHAQIMVGFTEFEKANSEAIFDLFEFTKDMDESALKKEEFKERLESLEKSKQNTLSKFQLKLDDLKINIGMASATFKPKDAK